MASVDPVCLNNIKGYLVYFSSPWLLHSSRHHRGKTENWDFGKLKGGDNEYHLVMNLAVDLSLYYLFCIKGYLIYLFFLGSYIRAVIIEARQEIGTLGN